MTRKTLEENLGRKMNIRLHDGAEYTGILHKTGEEKYKNNPNVYYPKNYYFVEDEDTGEYSCIFRVSHVQNYKTLR